MALRKQYREIKLVSKEVNPIVATDNFRSSSYKVQMRSGNSWKYSKNSEGRYKIQGIETEDNIWRSFADIKYMIDEILDNPRTVYTSIKNEMIEKELINGN